MTEKILVAYDGSASAEKAFEFGLDLAMHYRAELVVLAVAQLPEPPGDVETEAVLEQTQEAYAKQFAALKQKAAALGQTPQFQIAVGHPAEQIVRAAEDKGIDHIVMGRRGKIFFERWLIGSVSKQVIDYAACSVTVVR